MIDMLIRFTAYLAIASLSIFVIMMFQDAFNIVRNGLEDDDEFNEDED